MNVDRIPCPIRRAEIDLDQHLEAMSACYDHFFKRHDPDGEGSGWTDEAFQDTENLLPVIEEWQKCARALRQAAKVFARDPWEDKRKPISRRCFILRRWIRGVVNEKKAGIRLSNTERIVKSRKGQMEKMRKQSGKRGLAGGLLLLCFPSCLLKRCC